MLDFVLQSFNFFFTIMTNVPIFFTIFCTSLERDDSCSSWTGLLVSLFFLTLIKSSIVRTPSCFRLVDFVMKCLYVDTYNICHPNIACLSPSLIFSDIHSTKFCCNSKVAQKVHGLVHSGGQVGVPIWSVIISSIPSQNTQVFQYMIF